VFRTELWKDLQVYGVNGRLLLDMKSLHFDSDVCVVASGLVSEPFADGIGFGQLGVQAPIPLISLAVTTN